MSITDEQRELFVTIWVEKIPEVVNWSDEEIEYAMLFGA